MPCLPETSTPRGTNRHSLSVCRNERTAGISMKPVMRLHAAPTWSHSSSSPRSFYVLDSLLARQRRSTDCSPSTETLNQPTVLELRHRNIIDMLLYISVQDKNFFPSTDETVLEDVIPLNPFSANLLFNGTLLIVTGRSHLR